MPRVGAASGAAAALALAAAVLGTGCLDEAALGPSPRALVVAQAAPERLVLRLDGLAVNTQPEPYRPEVPNIPLAAVAEEGEAVAEGDPLFALNQSVAELKLRYRDLDIARKEADVLVDRLRLQEQIAELRRRRRELEQRVGVLDAQIAATRRRDAESLRIIEMEAEAAQATLRAASQRLAGLRTLREAGIADPEALEEAERARRRAREAARLPALRLELERGNSGAVDRRLHQFEREELRIELGEESGVGLRSRIAALQRRIELAGEMSSRWLRRRQRQREHYRELLRDNVVTAQSSGVVQHRRGGLRIGQDLRKRTALFVLGERDMGMRFDLPEGWRDLLALARDAEDTVRVDAPRLRIRDRRGRIHAVAALPHRVDSSGRRAYRCTVALERPLPGLRDGMHVDCRLRLPMPGDALLVPIWCLGDEHDPWVETADGQRIAVRGMRAGHHFIVLDGLAPGVRLRARPSGDGRQRLRLHGLVEPQERIDLDVPWRSELIDFMPDGSAVEAGDRIAQLRRTRGMSMEDRLEEAQTAREEAELRREVERLQAESDLAQRQVAWRKARVGLLRARLEAVLERYGSYSERELRAEIAVGNARLRLEQRQSTHDRLSVLAARELYSAHERRSAELALRRAEDELAQTELDAAAAARARDWVRIWRSDAAVYDAEARLHNERMRLRRSRERYRLSLARAEQRYHDRLAHARHNERRVDELTVRAPRSGQVYHYRHLRAGEQLHTTRPFFMPVGNGLRVRIEVPAQHYGRIAIGERLPLYLPVVDRVIDAEVSAISPHLFPSRSAASEEREAVGDQQRVFELQLNFTLDEEFAAQVQPGVSAWLALPATGGGG